MPGGKPNILVLWGDDIGWWNISHNNRGQMGYETPNIDRIAREGIEFTDYEGPSSLVTSLAYHSRERGLNLRTLVVEVPHYPFLEMPTYPRSILKTTETLSSLLGLDIDLAELREATDEANAKLNEIMAENEEFASLVAKLEGDYDEEETSGDEEALKRLIDKIDLGGDPTKN